MCMRIILIMLIVVLGLISDTLNKELAVSDPGTAQDETNDGQSLRVTHYLKLDGNIDLFGESQLLQDLGSILDVTSAGKLQRDQQGTTNYFNYNYWSSPVSPVNTTANNTDYTVDGVLRDGSNSNNPLNLLWTNSYDADGTTTPITLSRRWIWVYENYPNYADPLLTYADWRYLTETGTLAVGLGYTMKGSGVGDPVLDEQNYVFEGKPNNGVITTPVTGGNQALVGNPYPSAIDAVEFIKDNIPGASGNPGSSSSIDGTVYFWEHYISNFTHVLEDYEGGYATYNLTGGNAAISPPLISGNGTPNKFPERYIPVGQGFYVVSSPAGGDVTFKNNQRVFAKEAIGTSIFMEANENTAYITNAPTDNNSYDYGDDEDEEIKRVRINCKTPEGQIRSLLLGFVPNGEATDGVDMAYDALNTDELPNDFSWVIEGNFYSTQGVGDFDSAKQYPIGVWLDNPGDIEISLLETENFTEAVNVYIYDSILDTYTEIINANIFMSSLDTGTYSDRFYLAFTNGELGLSEVEFDNILINYLQETKELYINLPDATSIQEITILNVIGQVITTYEPEDFININSNELRIPVSFIAEGAYIVKVESDLGETNKKIIIGD